jgi:hypothetical protein
MPTLSTPLQALRPESVILMGKNTMMKRSIRLYCEETGNDQWAPILDMLVGNVGIVFTKADLSQVRGVCGCRQRECLGACMPTKTVLCVCGGVQWVSVGLARGCCSLLAASGGSVDDCKLQGLML